MKTHILLAAMTAALAEPVYRPLRPYREPRRGPASRFGCSWHPEANRRNKAAKARRRLAKARRKAAARARRVTVEGRRG